jgi:hypothetical protein
MQVLKINLYNLSVYYIKMKLLLLALADANQLVDGRYEMGDRKMWTTHLITGSPRSRSMEPRQ